MRRLIFAGILALVFSPAFAAPPTCDGTAQASNACLQWAMPTTLTDGNSIPDPTAVTVNIYGHSGTNPVAQLFSGLAQTSARYMPTVAGHWCFSLTAVYGGAESAKTTEVCKDIFITPAAPGTFTVK